MNPSNSSGRWFADLTDSEDGQDCEGFEDADYGDDVLEAVVDGVVGARLADTFWPRTGGTGQHPRFFAGEGLDPRSPLDEGTPTASSIAPRSGNAAPAYAEDPGSPVRSEAYAEDSGQRPAQQASIEDPGSPVESERQAEDSGQRSAQQAYVEDPGSPARNEVDFDSAGERPARAAFTEDLGSPPAVSANVSAVRADCMEDLGSTDAQRGEYHPISSRTTALDATLRLGVSEVTDCENVGAAPNGAESVTIPSGFRTGVWLDVSGAHLSAHLVDHLAKLRALQIQDACVMINSDQATRFGYGAVSKSVIASMASALRAERIQLTLTSWLRPERAFIDALAADLPAFARSLAAKAIEFDVEAPWTRVAPSGFANHSEAAEYLFRRLDAVRQAGIEVSVTYMVDTATSDRMRRLLQLADLVVPQAYSTNPAGAEPATQQSHRIGASYGPIGLQTRAMDQLDAGLAASASKDVILGLAAYARDQWPGHRPDAILEMEANAAVTMAATRRVKGIRYWSWKWVVGHDGRGGSPANSYAERFLSGLLRSTGATPTTTAPALPVGAPATAVRATPEPVASPSGKSMTRQELFP